ncbi:MAG: NAD(P)-binding protein, partial [Candidatus Tectimicrobiota bacterium]
MRVAVVGASLAGLAAGALLARRGCQVTVFEAAAQPEALGEKPGLAGMNRVPGDHLIWGWRSSRPLMRLFGALKDRPGATARSLLQPIPTGLQVLGHPYRLDWGERLVEEIGREFPGALPAWRACMAAWEREAETLRLEDVGNPFLPSPQRATEANLDAVQEEASPAVRTGRHAMGGKTLVAGPVDELSAEMRAYLNGFAQ